MEVLELIQLVEEQYSTVPKKYLADIQNPLEKYNDKDFNRRFRFSKEAFLQLYSIIKDDVEIDCRAHALPPLLQLACGLRFFATGHFQQTDGDLIGIGRRTAQRA